MKTKIISLAFGAILTLGGFSSCSDVVYEDAITSTPCTQLDWSNEGRKLTLTWALPAGATGTIIYKDNTKLIQLDNGETSYTIKRADTNRDNIYTVKAVYPDGRVSEGISTAVNIKYDVTTKAGFLLLADDYTKLTDDDEIEAAAWFKENYVDKGTGVWVRPSEVATLNVDEVACLMIIIDRVAMPLGYANLPADVVSVFDDIKAYVQDEGKLFLVNHATQIVEAIGRTNGFQPGIYGNGGGGENPDEWNIQCCIGNIDGQIYDHRGHAIFSGTTKGMQDGHEVVLSIGAGVKEDHNCMWDLNSYGMPANPNVVATFESINNCSVLATWGQITDYCCAGIVEFNPTTEFTGRIIAVGLGAYEFSQPGRDNTTDKCALNVKMIAKNVLEYLQ